MIQVVGIGPGRREGRTIAADDALRRADVIVGFTTYVALVRDEFAEKQFVTTGMRGEKGAVRAGARAFAGRKTRGADLFRRRAGLRHGLASAGNGGGKRRNRGCSGRDGGAQRGGRCSARPSAGILRSSASLIKLTPWATMNGGFARRRDGGFPLCAI